jgi:anti-anti-sigma factor
MIVGPVTSRNTPRGEAAEIPVRHSAAVEIEAVRLRVPFDALDLATVDAFVRWASGQVDATDGDMVLDLADVEFVMAAGVQALVDLDARLRCDGRTLAVTDAAPIVVRVLRICGLADGWIRR